MPRPVTRAKKPRRDCLGAWAIVALVLLLAGSWSHAARRDFFFEQAPPSDLLVQQTITDLLQDHDGYIWIATQGGLHRYDGQNVRRFQRHAGDPLSLPDSFVTAIVEGAPGELLVGTQTQYLSRLDLASGRFTAVAGLPGRSANIVDLHYQPDRGLWIASGSGLEWLALDSLTPRIVAVEGTPRSLATDPSGQTWMATTEGLYRLDADAGATLVWDQSGIESLLAEPDQVLVGTDHGLYRVSGSDGIGRREWVAPQDRPGSAAIRAMVRTRDGHLWLALSDWGLVRLSPDFRNAQTIQEVPGLPGSLPEDSIRVLMLDRSGVLWVGGQMRGVALTDPLGARFPMVYDDRPSATRVRGNSIRTILPDGDNLLWLGTDGSGLKRYDLARDRFEDFDRTLESALEGNGAALRVHGLVRAGDLLWISSDRGLLRMDTVSGKTQRVGADGTPLRSALRHMTRSADGRLWIGSNAQGLLEFEPGTGLIRQYRKRPGDPESLSQDFVHVVMEDRRGRLWVGTDDGLNLLDRITGKFQRFQYRPDEPESLGGSRIRALAEDGNGDIWIGTHSGLSLLRENSDGSLGFQRFNGLPDDPDASLIVFGIVPDPAGRLWLSTSSGIVQFDPGSGYWRRHRLHEGLQDYEFNGGAYAGLADGRIVLGGIRGFNLFDPRPSEVAATLPQPVLLSARIDGQNADRPGIAGIGRVDMAADSQVLQLGFGVLDYSSRGQIRYRYRMRGLDDDWIDAGNHAEATYTHLPSGHYRFEVQARHAQGDWNQPGLALPIHSQAPWWATDTAYVVWVLLALAAIILIVLGIIERRRQESALLAAVGHREGRLKLALWGSGDEFWDWDIGGNRLYRLGSDSLLGAEAHEDIVDTDLWRSEAIHPDDLPRVQQILQQHILGKIEYFESEHRVRNAQDQWIWVLSRGKIVERDENGDPLRMAGTARDITASRRAERDRRIALEVLKSMGEAVAVTDIDFNFVSVNKAFSRITGYNEAEVVGRSSGMLDSGQHSGEFYERLRRTARENGHWAGEIWQRRKDGEEFLGWIEISEVKDDHDQRSHFVAVVNDITDKKRAEQELRYLANYDTLTGLPNRALLSERLARAIVRARRQDTRIAVLFLDLDRFKDINDSLGHSAGDRILKASAARLLAIVGPGDTVARLGGDEFTVVLEDVDSLESVDEAAQRVLAAFSEPLEIDDRNDVSITPSVGISLYPDHGLVPTDLLKFADTAMYQAKGAGRNTYQIYTETMDAETRQRATMAAALRKALDRGEFRLLYQPRLSLIDGKITGVEALLRWHSQELGEVTPTEFIPLAEESGLILQIGEWVIREACITLHRWRRQGLMDIAMAVNVSVLQLLRGNLPEVITRTLAEIDVPADRVELEVTESMVMANAAQTTATLNALRALGLSIAIDDFGTGYSSLVYLKRLPIDTLKIDKEFVGDLTNDPDDEAITATVITMSHSLGLNVIAEGVETQQQLDYLREQGCDEIQGYWLSPPLDAHHCLAFMRTWQPSIDDDQVELGIAADKY